MTPKRSFSDERTEDYSSSRSSSKINENEPMPMRNKKPVLKHPNATDNFRDTHQTEYNERGYPVNSYHHVNAHNDACPKLKDELDKKNDDSKPRACQTQQMYYNPGGGIRCATQTYVSQLDSSNPHCIMCSKRRHATHISRRRTRRDKRARYSRDKKARYSRVSKSRRRPRPKPMNINKAHSRTHSTNNESQNVELPKPTPKNSESEVSSTRYPDTSPCSSYRSFFSIDHEPMCSN